MFGDNAHRGRDHNRGSTRGRSYSVSVMLNCEVLINVIKAVGGRGDDKMKTDHRSSSVSVCFY